MKTKILLSAGLLGVSALTSNAATVSLFTGGDVGEGIDFNNVLRATNIGQNAAYTVGTTTFQAYSFDPTFTACNWTVIDSFGAKPNYGDTAADNALENVMLSIGHGVNTPTVVWSGLTANTMYKVQVLAADTAATNANRGSSFQLITGDLSGTVADEALNNSLYDLQGGAGGGATKGVVITLMGMSDSSGKLSFRAVDSSGFLDNNSIANGIILSQVPEPSSALLGGLGVLALLRRRRA